MKCTNMHSEIIDVYSKYAILRPADSKWCGQHKNGRADITDDYHQGWNTTSISTETVALLSKFFGTINAQKLSKFRVFWAFHMEMCILWFPNTWDIESCVQMDTKVFLSHTKIKTFVVLFQSFATICCRRQEIPMSNKHRILVVFSPLQPHNPCPTLEWLHKTLLFTPNSCLTVNAYRKT